MIELAVRAHVRHERTDYDEFLASGREQIDARAQVSDQVDAVPRR